MTGNATSIQGIKSPKSGHTYKTTSVSIASGLGNTSRNINHGIPQDGRVDVWTVRILP